jgi:hypothetical protein
MRKPPTTLDSIPEFTASFKVDSIVVCVRCGSPNRRFKFHKRCQLFICTHNETLSVAMMRVSNPEG